MSGGRKCEIDGRLISWWKCPTCVLFALKFIAGFLVIATLVGYGLSK